MGALGTLGKRPLWLPRHKLPQTPKRMTASPPNIICYLDPQTGNASRPSLCREAQRRQCRDSGHTAFECFPKVLYSFTPMTLLPSQPCNFIIFILMRHSLPGRAEGPSKTNTASNLFFPPMKTLWPREVDGPARGLTALARPGLHLDLGKRSV